MPYCPTCGTEVNETDVYCADCGEPLDEPSTSAEDSAAATTTDTTPATSASDSTEKSQLFLSEGQLQSRVQGLGDYEFEQFVAELWGRIGWETEVTQASADAGIDVIATKEKPYPQKKVIQAKRYSDNTTVGAKDIQQYASLQHQVEGADSVIVVTTSRFTGPAEERAAELNVKLVDGERLVEMIHQTEAQDLVAEYLSVREQTSPPEDSSTRERVDEEPESTEEMEVEAVTKAEEDRVSLTEWDRWHWVAAGCGVLTYGAVDAPSSVGGLLLLLTGLTLYLDIRHIRRVSDWSPRAWLYLSGLIVALLSLPVYLINRYRFVSSNL